MYNTIPTKNYINYMGDLNLKNIFLALLQKDSVYFEPWLVLKVAVIAFSIFNVGIFLVVRMLGHKLVDIFLQLINVGKLSLK